MTDPTPQTTPTRDEAVPTGWKIVPIEPLPEMLGAFWRVKNGHHFADEPEPTDRSDYAAYRAMLASAPAPAAGGVDAVREAAERVRTSRRRHSGTYESSPFEFYPVQEVDALLHAIDLGGKIECEECSGAGHTGIEGNDVYDCPACNGEGSLSPAATPVSEAGGEAVKVLATLNRMVTDYLVPDTYKARFPKDSTLWEREFSMPDKHHSDAGAALVHQRRDAAFIRDVIHLQDNPTGVEPSELAALAKPAFSPAGVREELAANLLTAYHAIDAAWLASTGAQRLAKHDALAAIHEASRALSQSTSAGRG